MATIVNNPGPQTTDDGSGVGVVVGVIIVILIIVLFFALGRPGLSTTPAPSGPTSNVPGAPNAGGGVPNSQSQTNVNVNVPTPVSGGTHSGTGPLTSPGY